jgi:hypothetical protein
VRSVHQLRRLSPVLLAAALLTGCSSGDDPAEPTAASSSTTTSPSSGSASPSGTEDSPGCPPSGNGVPEGAQTRPTLDVDGDGRADTLWIDEDDAVRFGVTTVTGATFTADFDSASPVSRSVLVADVTGEGELIALANDGRQVLLFAISSCSFVPVQNAQGEQYAFDLGFTGYGTGVGCADVDGDGVRDLLGLRAGDHAIMSTPVLLDGPRATNSTTTTGVTDNPPADLERARQVTCGDLTMADDGVSVGA